jgi:hypothetical protein
MDGPSYPIGWNPAGPGAGSVLRGRIVSECALLELARHLALPTPEVKLDLLEQTTSVARTMARRVKFVHQRVYGGFACAVAVEGREIRVHHVLGLGDGARTIRGCKADDEVHGFSEAIHATGIADRR